MSSLLAPDAPYKPYRPISTGSASPLKPITLVDAHGYSPSHSGDVDVDGEFHDSQFQFRLEQDSRDDARLKHRIRMLKVASRTVATILSIGSLIPVAFTLHKFESTKNIFRDVKQPTGTTVNRNLWAKDNKLWPTLMYTAVAAISVLLNAIVMISYFGSVRRANRAAKVATTFSWIIILGNLGVWIAAAAIYRQQKNLNGKPNDLWGWSCSSGAQQIQKVFRDQINFSNYCTTQSLSWYFGLAQCGAAILSVIIYILAMIRLRKQKRIKNYSGRGSSSIRSYERI